MGERWTGGSRGAGETRARTRARTRTRTRSRSRSRSRTRTRTRSRGAAGAGEGISQGGWGWVEGRGDLITHRPCQGPVHQPWGRGLSRRANPTTRVRAVPAAALRVTRPSPDSWRPVFHVRRPGEGRVASSATGGSRLCSRHALVGTDQVPLLSPGSWGALCSHLGLMLMDNPVSVHLLS